MAAKKKAVHRASGQVQERAARIHERLIRALPEPHIELRFDNPWQLLLAVILSAQSTDVMINRVMPVLLGRWSSPDALARAAQEDVEEVI